MVILMATYVCLHQHVQSNRWRTHSRDQFREDPTLL
jgi:hypothetical protein